MSRKIVKRKPGEAVVIGDVVVESMKGGRMAIYAKKEVPIWCGELDPERLERVKKSEERENGECGGKSEKCQPCVSRPLGGIGREED